MSTNASLAERIRQIDLRNPETLDIFELRAAVEKVLKDIDLPEFDTDRLDLDRIDFDRLDVLGLRDLLEKVELPEVERTDVEDAFDRFDMLGLRKAIVDADRVEFSVPSSPGDVVSQLDDIRSSFESIVKNVFDNAQDLTPVTRKDLADLEKRVIAAEKAAKKATTKKATAKKAPARKRPAAKKAAVKS